MFQCGSSNYVSAPQTQPCRFSIRRSRLRQHRTPTRRPGTLSGIVPFSFGLQFDPQVFRPTGNATYVGLVLAHARAEGGSNAYEISGTMHLDANYDIGETSGYFELKGRNDVTGEIVGFGRINILPSRRDTLDVIISATDTSGGGLQAFYTGKQAQELMGAFEAQLTDPRSPSRSLRATGSFAAKR